MGEEAIIFFFVGVEPEGVIGVGRAKGHSESRGCGLGEGSSGDMSYGADEGGEILPPWDERGIIIALLPGEGEIVEGQGPVWVALLKTCDK